MKTFSRRKFVEAALVSGMGVSIFPELTKAQDRNLALSENNIVSGTVSDNQGTLARSEAHIDNPEKEIPSPDFNTMRPIRNKNKIKITVGQTEGDLQGKDDKVIQAAIDYVFRLGGGIVHILPGVYMMRNSIYPKPGITIRGSGDKTILRKTPSVSSNVIREADWFEYCVQVEDPKGFVVGGGIALSADKKNDRKVSLYTITAIENNVLYLDNRTEENFWMEGGGRASTRFSIIYGLSVDNVCVENIVLDGNRAENEYINDNYAGAVFMQYCNKWNFKNVTARDYNGDGFSFQVCDDVHFEDCSSINNFELGFHPGSGSQRPVFKRCISKGNSQGFYWCWSACDGIAEDCTASENLKYGFNFGHRDTDNILRNCIIERNEQVGVLFRKEPGENRQGDRNILENCVIRDNGKEGKGFGIDIQWKTNDITIRNCRIENTTNGSQKVGIRISPEAQRISMEKNTIEGCPIKVEDLRIS